MQIGKTYTIKGSRMENAVKKNMVKALDSLRFKGGGRCVFKALDSAKEGFLWGRLQLEYEISGAGIIEVKIMSGDENRLSSKGELIDDILSDESISVESIEELSETYKVVSAENQHNILLYALKGRYLWIEINVKGDENVTGVIDFIKVFEKGDNFMDIFPEVYRERNSFFHRYISVFSTIYNEMQSKFEHITDIFDADKTPKELLPILAEWLGIDVYGDFLDETQLRQFVKEAYRLNKGKGTKKTLKRVAEITIGEEVVIKEKNVGDNSEQCDITVMISKVTDQNKKAGILYILEQFKPVRSSMKIMFLSKNSKIDGNSYLDMNAAIEDGTNKALDSNENYENIILK